MTTPTAQRLATPRPQRRHDIGATLWILRAALVVQAVAAIGQPVLAGQYLAGDFDALATHAVNAGLLFLTAIGSFLAATLYWLVGRGRGWPALISLVLFVAIIAQTAFGALRILAVHIPLGVAIVTTAVALAIWSFCPSARRTRPVPPREVAR